MNRSQICFSDCSSDHSDCLPRFRAAKIRCYQLAKVQYQKAQKLKLPRYMKDRKRFYEIAFASHRETQTIFDLIENQELIRLSDQLAGGLYNLIRSLKSQA